LKEIQLDVLDAEQRFHLGIVTFSGNNMLLEAYERFNIHPMMSSDSAADYLSDDGSKRILRQHNQLINAIEKRDGDEAERVVREHLGRAIRILSARLSEKELNDVGS